ncbi:MAG: glycosyltransferase [Chloroflexota bacterium]|nr:glycosyltransferase [Chloroflexota bacterium]
MKRVLWTSPHCRPDWLDRLGKESQGGQSVVMNKLPHALARTDSGIHLDIFTRMQDNDPYAVTPVKFLNGNPRVRIVRLPCGPTDRYIPKEFLYGEPIAGFVEHILAFADREGLHYDLLHGHYADGWEAVTSLGARWSHHPPTLLTTHSLGRRKQWDALKREEGKPEELDRRYNFSVRGDSEERSLAVADRILPLSTSEAEFLNAHYEAVPPGDPRVTVIPNGIDLADFPPAPPGTRACVRASLGVADSEFLLLVPSRVDPRKGQENILRALVEIRESRPALIGVEHRTRDTKHIRVLFLAWPEHSTDYTIRLKQFIAEHGLDYCVLTHPPVPHARMPNYFAAADGVALPSQEYFSIVMLEAMLLEHPLIASVHGGSRDAISDGINGLLVDHNDVAQLAQAIVWLVGMDEAARREMGRRARQTILEGYTWDRVAQRLLAIYHQATAHQP